MPCQNTCKCMYIHFFYSCRFNIRLGSFDFYICTVFSQFILNQFTTSIGVIIFYLHLIYKQIFMGNTIESMSQNKTTLITGLTAFAFVSYVIHDALVKRSFRNKLFEALDNQLGSIRENTNQLYLKNPLKQYWLRSNPKHPVYKIVITGGPCGGKSSSFDKIRKIFTQKGFRVLCVPQINTMVVLGGAGGLIPQLTKNQLILYQTYLIRFQIFAEDYFTKLAQMSNQPAIVLCDRGTVDAYAYMTDEAFQAVLDQQGWSWVTLRDKRYDLVCFLTSAANGAQKYYTVQNNAARSQGIQLARKIDKRTLQAWTGHPHIVVSPNIPGQSFDDKINRVIQAVRNMVGQELHTLVNHKLLINKPIFPADVKHQQSQIQQIFLVSDDPRCKQNKLKKRGCNFSYSYYQKFVFKTEVKQNTQQLRKQLIPKQYMALKQTKADKQYAPVVRTRIDFIWNNFSYCIDIYDDVEGQDKVYLLRFFARKNQIQDFIPPFIEVVRNVQNEPEYKLKTIAKKLKQKNDKLGSTK